MSGPMCGLDEAIGYVEALHPVADPMPERIVRRLKYMKSKEDGIKPTFHPGIYGKKFDSYHCGNCAKEGLRITDNFCPNCGYRILWDSTRCLTR